MSYEIDWFGWVCLHYLYQTWGDACDELMFTALLCSCSGHILRQSLCQHGRGTRKKKKVKENQKRDDGHFNGLSSCKWKRAAFSEESFKRLLKNSDSGREFQSRVWECPVPNCYTVYMLDIHTHACQSGQLSWQSKLIMQVNNYFSYWKCTVLKILWHFFSKKKPHNLRHGCVVCFCSHTVHF